MKPQMILVGDIGGTKATLALFDEKNRSLEQVTTFASGEYAGLHDILRDFLSQTSCKIERACLGVPGPVVKGKCQTTHHRWLISADEVKDQLNSNAVFLINDMATLAHAIPFLPEDQFEVLQSGDAKKKDAIGLIAVGTGLGQACLLMPSGGDTVVLESEGGHCDFAPRTEPEIELLRFLLEKYERVSIERVLSGYGLFRIYQFISQYHSLPEPAWLARDFREKDPAAVITENAKKSPACKKAFDMFVSIYGAVAGNIALQTLGDVYLGGGITPKILSQLKEGIFMEAFLAKGRFGDLLRRTSVKVIMNEKAPLIGAAHYALRQTAK